MLQGIKFIYKGFAFIFKLLSALLNVIFLTLYQSLLLIIKRFKFSMAFKINFLYSLVYIILFAISFFYLYKVFVNYIAVNPDALSMLIESYLDFIPILLGVSLLIFSFTGYILVRQLLKPIQDMTLNVKSIEGSNLKRLDTDIAKDELKDLTLTFNEMLDRLENYMTHQKQFVSDVSHELRTPIAIIQGYTEMLQRWGKNDPAILEESITSLSQEIENMKNLIEKLLFLSRNDKTLQMDKHPFNLSHLCEEILKETRFIDDDHVLLSKITPNVFLEGDIGLIKELIRIFIDNALKYTPIDGVITLTCTTSKNAIILSIKDTGIGIPQEHLSHLFERFYRVDEARNKNSGGYGLGLSIAQQIITAHQAQVSITSALGSGSEFIIFFPTSS